MPCDCTFTKHLGPQVKTAGKLHDFLMNPKSRPDLQTPEGQAFLKHLERFYHNDKTDPLMPWLTREWKKGRITYDPTTADAHGGEETMGHLRTTIAPGNDVAWPHGSRLLRPQNVDHWADFFRANHPVRRGLGDIMQHHVPSYNQHVLDWDEALKQEAHEQALTGGEVVHTTPDNWTVRRLHTPEELSAEGDAMGHCVGGYHGAVSRGDTQIYSLRDPNNSPHITTEISPRVTAHGPWNGPNQGQVVQIQGKANQEPQDEYKARLADWFRSYPSEQRPTWQNEEDGDIQDDEGYYHSSLDHPDLIPSYKERNGGLAPRTEPTEDSYGILRRPAQVNADHDDLLSNIKLHEAQTGTFPDTDHIDDVYALAKARGEIPQLGEALQGYSTTQQDDFDNWMDQNYQYAPRYPDPDMPHGFEDEEGNEVGEGEGRPYWEPTGSDYGERYYDPAEAEAGHDRALGEWEHNHGGMRAVDKLYTQMNPHFGTHPTTGEQGFWNELPQQPEQPPPPPTIAKVARSTSHENPWGDQCHCPWFRPQDKEVVGAVKEAAKIDWLIERQDKFSRTPEGQTVLAFLQAQVDRNPKIDPLTPWLYREGKKGQLTFGGQTMILNDGRSITPPQLDHWADWFASNSPTRRGVDIMQMAAGDMVGRVDDWDEELRRQQEEAQAKEGSGQIVHRFDGDDQGWTVRRLRDAQEAKEEGDLMGHCVGSYGNDIESGRSQIFSLRDPQNEPHTTTEIRPANVNPYMGTYHIPEHVWNEVPQHHGVSIDRLGDMHDKDQSRMFGDNPDRTEHEQAALDDFRKTYGHVPLEDGEVIQTQGKSNDVPLQEYTQMLDQWMEPHGLQSYKPWWDDHYDVEGPENFRELLGHNGEHDGKDFNMGGYPSDEWYEYSEPEDYRHAEHDAEEHGVEGPELRYGGPEYDKILESLIDPEEESGYGYDEQNQHRLHLRRPPWRGYNPEAGQYVLEHAQNSDKGETRNPEWAPYNREPATHVQSLADALQLYTRFEDLPERYTPQPDVDQIVDPYERQRVIEQRQREQAAKVAADPRVQMLNHLGPQMWPGYVQYGDTPTTTGVHPGQTQLWNAQGIPYNAPQTPGYAFSKTASLYQRWVFSPASGNVELADNSGDPLAVRYHTDLARELNEPGLIHGYAHPIDGAWRLFDWEGAPVEDANVIASVMRQLQASKARSGPQDASWDPSYEEDWDRMHLGLPS